MCLVNSILHPTLGKCYHVILLDKHFLAFHSHSLSFVNAALNMNDSLGTNEQILERLKSFSKPDYYPIEYLSAVVAHFAAIPGSKRDPTVREIFSLMTHIRETACNNLGARLGLPAGGLALLINARNQKGDQEISELREEVRLTVKETG